jgi:hypothetical protein
MGREYAIAVADPTAAAVNTAGSQGDILIIGDNANWASVAARTGTRDYVAVTHTPNFIGDRCLVVLGSTGAANGVALEILNSATNNVVQTAPLTAAGGTTLDYDGAAAAASSILSGDIALPNNFDPSSAGGRRAYVTIASVAPTTDNDVYRADDDTCRVLGMAAGTPVKSVAYSGTVDTGTLLAGYYNRDAATGTVNIKRTTNPTTTSPTWVSTDKAPNAAVLGQAVVRLATDFATSNRVYCGTAGNAAGQNNGFFRSNDGGASFDGEVFLNSVANNVVRINGLKLTPDGSLIYLATDDGTYLNLWKSSTPVSSTSWSRVFSAQANTPGNTSLLEVSREYSKTPAVFLVDVDAAAQANIYVSQNGATTFATRLGPAAAPRAIAAQDAQVVYMGVGANVYKSTNACWTWSTPEDGKAGNITNMVVPRYDDLIIGGTSDTAWSTDGGTSFTGKNTGLTGVGAVYISVDNLYPSNQTLYIAGADGNAYRWVIGESSQWDTINAPAPLNPLVSSACPNGVLYVMDNNAAGNCDRAIEPTAVPGTINWTVMNAGQRPNAAAFMTAVGTSTENVIYVADATVNLWSYKDWLAVNTIDPITPADKATVQVDPVNGRGMPIDVSFMAMGSGTGAVNQIDFECRKKNAGLVGAATSAGNAVAPSAPSFTFFSPTNVAGTFFEANTEYIWSVRVSNTVSADAVTSPWSKPRTFMVQSGSVVQQPYAGPVIQGPNSGAMNVNPNLVGFAWAPVAGATEYTLIIATDAALTNTIAGTPVKLTTTAYEAAGLEHDTTYFWSVQATAPTVGPQAIATFTTAPKPTVAPTTAPPAATQPVVTPVIQLPAAETPAYIWAVIVIGAVLVVAVIILIVRTRRVP